MFVKPKTILFDNGINCVIKSPEIKDGVEMLTFEKQIAKESPFMVRYVNEIVQSGKEQANVIKRVREHPMQLMIGAYIDHKLVGLVTIMAVSEFIKARHRACLSIAVLKGFQGNGIANLLMKQCITYAKQMGFFQLELEVACINQTALMLYLTNGFIVYGMRKNAYRLTEQTFFDEYLMYRLL